MRPLAIHLHNMAQRTPAWEEIRQLYVGASDAKIVVSPGRNGRESAARRDLRMTKALAQLGVTVPTSRYTNPDIERGIRLEPAAISAVELETGCLVTPVGYVSCDTIAAGCSPDGFMGTETVLEVKCPRPSRQWATCQLNHQRGLEGTPTIYHPQILHTLAITGRYTLTYASYCPQLPPELELYLHEVYIYDVEEEVDAYLETLMAFLGEIEAEATALDEAVCRERATDFNWRRYPFVTTRAGWWDQRKSEKDATGDGVSAEKGTDNG